MLKRSLLVGLIVLIASSLIPLSMIRIHTQQGNEFQVRKGVMDLAAWNYAEQPILKLDGEWEFYWHRLLTPSDFRGIDRDALNTAYMRVPAGWNGKIVNGQTLPVFGFATYRMTLEHVPVGGVFALQKKNVRFSSKVYVNGDKLFEDGVPSERAADNRPGNVPQFGLFPAGQGNIEIVIQVANYDYFNAGIPASLYFGEQKAMTGLYQRNVTFEFSMLAALVVLAAIYLICFAGAALYRNRDYSLLGFALICVLYAIYHGLMGERTLLMLVPNLPFETAYRIKDVISFVSLISIASLFYHLQKKIVPLRLLQAFNVLLGAFAVLVVILPIRDYVSVQLYVIALYELMLLWLLARSAMLYVKGLEGNPLRALLLFLAILTINLYSLDILLFATSLKENVLTASFYLLFFNVVMILYIVLRFFEAYRTVEVMKDRLVVADKIKDDFLSTTSHELKTPLNAIVSITETLLRGVEGQVTKQQAQNLSIIIDSGKRLTHLVNELLDYAKLRHGDITLRPSGIKLRETVDSVLRMHAFLLGGKPIALINGVPAQIPSAYADGSRLIQILHNLVGNAIKFTERGEVEVSARTQQGHIEVCVRDTGIGIAPAQQQRIFQAFEQVDASETRPYEGTGLGLGITRKLVELQGGEITVDSDLGRGSTFRFTLPVAGEERKDSLGRERPAAADSSAAPHAASGSAPAAEGAYPQYIAGNTGEPVMIVDDDYANLQAMINLFKLEGVPLVIVNRGQAALDELAGRPGCELIILDIMMPDMSGFETLQRIRERFSMYELPVLMLTARNRASDVKTAMELGANDFVGKPFEAEELIARVRSLTRLRASVRNAANAEIAFLRSQIKPHFLYNALNAIATLCAEDPLKAEELTVSLSEYLRNSFDFKQLDALTPLNKELELVEAYVHIEQARFGNRLQVEYDIDVNRDARIPPLVLQPLVENAIRHGLMSRIEGGTVRISVKEAPGGGIRFEVADNGCGMSGQQLQLLQNPVPERKGVGLWNIDRRIKLLYGTGLEVKSVSGAGTIVTFFIPAEEERVTG